MSAVGDPGSRNQHSRPRPALRGRLLRAAAVVTATTAVGVVAFTAPAQASDVSGPTAVTAAVPAQGSGHGGSMHTMDWSW